MPKSKNINIKILKEPQQWDGFFIIRYLFLNEDKIIGSYKINFDRGFTKLEGFYVQPEYRKIGMGKFMLEHLKETYTDVDIDLEVRVDNYVAINLYKKYGWVFSEGSKEGFEWYTLEQNN